MSSDDPHAEIERELRAAFRAAAEAVQPSGQPLADRSVVAPSRASRGRWIAPAAVAAAVVAIGVPAALIAGRSGAPTTAPAAGGSVVTVADGYVTAAGVRFPLPDGWTALTSEETPEAVTVCVAARPSTDCDGVTLRVAVPDSSGAITPLPDPLDYEGSPPGAARSGGEMSSSAHDGALETPMTMTSFGGSSAVATTPALASPDGGARAGGVMSSSADDGVPDGSVVTNSETWAVADSSTEGTPGDLSVDVATPYNPATSQCPILENTDPLDGRPAQHVLMGACAPGSPQSLIWYVTDGSLTIWTPRGVAAAEATRIAAGIDFSGYRHEYGPQIAFVTSGDSAPPTTSTFSVPLGTAGTSLEVTAPADPGAGSTEAGPDTTEATR